MRGALRDNQRKKCYDWENEYFHELDGITDVHPSDFGYEHGKHSFNTNEKAFKKYRRMKYHPDNGYLTLEECQKLVDKAWKRWVKHMHRDMWGTAPEPPRVTDGRGRRGACAEGARIIKLPLWSRRQHVVLHEVAHAITYLVYWRWHASHGPEFMWVATDLYAWHFKCSIREVRKDAREHHLTITNPLKIKKKAHV